MAAKAESLFSGSHTVGHVVEGPAQPIDEFDEGVGVNLVRGGGQHGLLYPGEMDDYLRPRPLIDVDLVIVDSEADNRLPKLVWAEDSSIPAYDNVLAYVGPAPSAPELPTSAAYFAEKETLPLKQYLDEYFQNLAASVPLYGLVLTGGKSRRMGTDKGTLAYHGQSQVGHCHELLQSFCDRVFVSLREEQGSEEAYRSFPQIHDAFLGFGPMGGILSAQKAHPDSAWLVLACDLPYANRETLDNLVARRNPFKLATAYVSANDGFPEPLCAIYEPKSIFRLTQFLALGYHCPRKVLINSDTWLLELGDPGALDNVNTPAERDGATGVLAAHASRP